MDPSSPFAYRNEDTKTINPTTVVHVNFCKICHYVWKAPAAAVRCVNCIQEEDTAVSLIHYITEAPLT